MAYIAQYNEKFKRIDIALSFADYNLMISCTASFWELSFSICKNEQDDIFQLKFWRSLNSLKASEVKLEKETYYFETGRQLKDLLHRLQLEPIEKMGSLKSLSPVLFNQYETT